MSTHPTGQIPRRKDATTWSLSVPVQPAWWTAAGAAGLGAKVALIERHLMGGDCLNVGCVPSKGIIAAARAAHAAKVGGTEFGIEVDPDAVKIDFPAAMERMRKLRAGISKVDSAKTLFGPWNRRIHRPGFLCRFTNRRRWGSATDI